MIYLELFWSFFQIGLFSIGGGYAARPLIQHQVVVVHPWLTMAEFSDIITISQVTPGPISTIRPRSSGSGSPDCRGRLSPRPDVYCRRV